MGEGELARLVSPLVPTPRHISFFSHCSFACAHIRPRSFVVVTCARATVASSWSRYGSPPPSFTSPPHPEMAAARCSWEGSDAPSRSFSSFASGGSCRRQSEWRREWLAARPCLSRGSGRSSSLLSISPMGSASLPVHSSVDFLITSGFSRTTLGPTQFLSWRCSSPSATTTPDSNHRWTYGTGASPSSRIRQRRGRARS